MRVHCHVVEVNLVIATGSICPHGVAGFAPDAKAIDRIIRIIATGSSAASAARTASRSRS